MTKYTKNTRNLMDNYKNKPKTPSRARSKVMNQVTTIIKPQKIATKKPVIQKPPVQTGEDAPKYKHIITDTKQEFKIKPLPKLPKEEPKKKHKQHKAKGRQIYPVWSVPIRKFTKKDIEREHHFTFVQEQNGFKIYYKYYLVHGDETCQNGYGQYYQFSPDKAGTIHLTHEYFYQVNSLKGKKYKYKKMKVKDAKKFGIYRDDAYLSPEVALKQMNVFGTANCISLRMNTKLV